jgi:sulfate transport system permease protein
VTAFLSIVVILPIAALVWESRAEGAASFWDVVTSPGAIDALKLSLGAAAVVALINAVLGTITAWVLVRDRFRGQRLVNSIIDCRSHCRRSSPG